MYLLIDKEGKILHPLLKCLHQLRQGHMEPEDRERHLALTPEWQGLKSLGHPFLPSHVHWLEVGRERRQHGLE